MFGFHVIFKNILKGRVIQTENNFEHFLALQSIFIKKHVASLG